MRPTVACSFSAGSTTLTLVAPFDSTSRSTAQSDACELRRGNHVCATGCICATLAHARRVDVDPASTHQEGQRDRPAEAPATISCVTGDRCQFRPGCNRIPGKMSVKGASL